MRKTDKPKTTIILSVFILLSILAAGSFAKEKGAPKSKKTNPKLTVSAAKPVTTDGDTKIIKGIECVLVKAGTFTMGSPKTENGRDDDEEQYEVTITRDYWISKYPITNAQSNSFGNPNHPVTGVTWFDADTWARSKGANLPTEAQWEFAARGGNKSKGYVYSGSDNLDEAGWYKDNLELDTNQKYQYKPNPSGQKQPNELGIYDMSGNIWEWCGDWYETYPDGPVKDPVGPITNNRSLVGKEGSLPNGGRVARGGSWGAGAFSCRVASRSYIPPSYGEVNIGFRVVFYAD
jgi:formylglycine-generating enzyme required for sulfatase activity